MLATLTHEPFSHDDWIFERKFDGERCLTFKDGDSVKLLSRNKKMLNDTYPEIEEVVVKQPMRQFIIDGEIVAFEGDITSFGRLQQRMQIRDRQSALHSNVKVYYYVFDICYADGYDLTVVELRYRKGILKKALNFEDPVRFTEHRNRDGEAYYEEVCPRGWEGLIAKDATSSYVHSRSKKWLKFKCVREQEMVIGGFTDPERSRVGLGALLVGYYEDDALKYAGKVGTGYDDDTLRDLRNRLDAIEIEEPAYEPDDALPSRGVHWVKPQLVAQIKFTEWTEGGKLRHPVYLGLRDDKAPQEVRRES
ncbi:MAG: non-homologous end-joining DNA ligase, partial [Chloroflexota bacterium]